MDLIKSKSDIIEPHVCIAIIYVFAYVMTMFYMFCNGEMGFANDDS